MTALHTLIAGRYTGQAVVLMGNGAQAGALARVVPDGLPVIAVNRGVRHAPQADLLVSLDANWGAAADGYTGPRLVGFAGCTHPAAVYYPAPYEVVTTEGGAVLHIRSNLLAAMRLAVLGGASTILLAGMEDLATYERTHHAPGIVAGVRQLSQQVQAQGVTVQAFTSWAGLHEVQGAQP